MKRVLAIIMVMVLCFQFLSVGASAAEAGISLSSAEGLPGEQISVNVQITGNTGLAYLKLKIAYDSSVLTLISAENTGLLGGTYTTSKTTDVNPYVLQWMAAGNSVGDGVVATLTFEISDTAEAGEQTISLLFEECYDEEFNDVVFAPADGVVTVIMPTCPHTTKIEVPSKSADCVNSGNNLYFVCDSCGLAFKADGVTETTVEAETIAALGHDLTDADCTEAAKCQRQGCDYVEGSALGHSFTNYVSNDDATCTADGTKSAKCDRCDVTDTITDVGSAKGHDYADATCTDPKACKVCGATEGDPLGHSFTNYVSNNDATCTADGTKIAKCDRCDVTDTITDVGSAKGHDYADATCTTPKTCKVCGATEGDPLGHSYATAWSKGEDGHWHECSVCGDKTDFAAHDYGDGDKCVICEYERAHIHRLTLVPAVEATCTTDGNVAYYTCSGCENWFEDASGSIVISDKTSVVIAALGHDLTDATCTEAPHCKREGCEYTEGSALGHSFTNYVSNNDATCTEDGTKTAKCDRCDVTDTITDVGSAKGHDYADATCTTPKTCKVCSATEGDPQGHSYAATWSKGEDGHWHECSACGDKTDFAAHDYGDGDKCVICEYERAHIHRLTLVPAVEATCTTDGNVAYYTCSGCENWFEDAAGSIVISDKATVIISALGHDVVEATCTEAAFCQREGCDHTEGAALGHADENADNKCDRCGVSMGGEQPTTPDKPTDDVPQTGDISKSMLWAVVLMLSVAGTIICVLFSKKRNVT